MSQFFDSSFVLGYGVFSVDQSLRGGGSCMSFSLGPFRVWLSYGDEKRLFVLQRCLLGWVVVMGHYGYHFQWWFVTESDFGDEVYFGGYCPHGCW